MRSVLRSACAAIALLVAGSMPALSRDLIFARVSEHASIDPLFNAAGNDASTAPNMFESLIQYDSNFKMEPLLATSWQAISPTVWEFKLRKGVTFHDGSPFTAEDVRFSFDRATKVTGSPASWARSVALVEKVEIVDDHTIRVHTKVPAPLILDLIGGVYIVSHTAAKDVTTEDFNTGKAAIGTGAYKFVSWARGDRLKLAAYDNHWGGKPEFQNVTYRFISNNAARIAALLSGEVDIIDAVPPTEIETVKARKGISLVSGLTTRLTHLQMDVVRDDSPWITDENGVHITRNPLKDTRVREALSLMINRDLLVKRIAGGLGEPAGQIVPPGLGGYDPTITPDPYDPARAKQLLIEAGYPNGFGLTIQSTNDRFPEDSASLQAIAQMFTRGGIKINGVNSMPFSVLLQQQQDRKMTLFQYAYNGGGANASEFLKNILASPRADIGYGGSNRTLFSNPAFDAILTEALAEFDEPKRNALFARATRLVVKEQRGNLIPLYWQARAWAMRDDISFEANGQDLSILRFVHPRTK